MRSRVADWLLGICSAAALTSCAIAVWAAWRWPLVGDAGLMHYVVLLLQAGQAPYRQIVDINLPGSYLLEASAMYVFGAGAVGLRLYDGLLCLLACGCAAILSEADWRSRLCGLIGGLLFVLIHLRDGVVEGGERDLAMAVLVLLAYVALLRRPLAGRIAGLMLFEFLVGLTLTIKPTLLPLAALPLGLAWMRGRKLSELWKEGSAGMLCLFLPALAMVLWLHRWGALGAFVHVLRTVDIVHSRLARQSFFSILSHSLAPIPGLFALAIVLIILAKRLDAESKLLLAGIACGLLSLIVQLKGFPYQRYPFLLLALVLLARLVASGLAGSGLTMAVSGATLAMMGLWLAPAYAATVRSYDHSSPFEDALSRDLISRNAAASGVQCLDTVGGCINTLYDLHLIQGTGFLYDCYAYKGSEDQKNAYRIAFLASLSKARPGTIVLSSQFCLEPQPKLERVEQWPELKVFLAQNYRLDGGWQAAHSLHWWHQREQPPSYQIFTLK